MHHSPHCPRSGCGDPTSRPRPFQKADPNSVSFFLWSKMCSCFFALRLKWWVGSVESQQFFESIPRQIGANISTISLSLYQWRMIDSTCAYISEVPSGLADVRPGVAVSFPHQPHSVAPFSLQGLHCAFAGKGKAFGSHGVGDLKWILVYYMRCRCRQKMVRHHSAANLNLVPKSLSLQVDESLWWLAVGDHLLHCFQPSQKSFRKRFVEVLHFPPCLCLVFPLTNLLIQTSRPFKPVLWHARFCQVVFSSHGWIHFQAGLCCPKSVTLDPLVTSRFQSLLTFRTLPRGKSLWILSSHFCRDFWIASLATLSAMSRVWLSAIWMFLENQTDILAFWPLQGQHAIAQSRP